MKKNLGKSSIFYAAFLSISFFTQNHLHFYTNHWLNKKSTQSIHIRLSIYLSVYRIYFTVYLFLVLSPFLFSFLSILSLSLYFYHHSKFHLCVCVSNKKIQNIPQGKKKEKRSISGWWKINIYFYCGCCIAFFIGFWMDDDDDDDEWMDFQNSFIHSCIDFAFPLECIIHHITTLAKNIKKRKTTLKNF